MPTYYSNKWILNSIYGQFTRTSVFIGTDGSKLDKEHGVCCCNVWWAFTTGHRECTVRSLFYGGHDCALCVRVLTLTQSNCCCLRVGVQLSTTRAVEEILWVTQASSTCGVSRVTWSRAQLFLMQHSGNWRLALLFPLNHFLSTGLPSDQNVRQTAEQG